ncbi:MAG: hypothetical protein GXP31_00955 [Kiritimatiellaeota bacterium]|nr:hypothetical protein [Kiritimatiellota bacterium]
MQSLAKIRKRAATALGFFCMVFSSGRLGAQPPTLPSKADLIGYGRVRMSVDRSGPTGGVAEFACENERYADFVLGKLIADLTWDGRLGIRRVSIGAGLTVLQLDGYDLLLAARKGPTVIVVAGRTPDEVRGLLKRRGLVPAELILKPKVKYPDSLDAFDLKCIKFERHPYYLPSDIAPGLRRFARQPNLDIYRFWDRFGIGMGAMHRWYLYQSQMVDGPAHLFPLVYDVELANAAGQAQAFHIGAVRLPRWLRNRFPDQCVRFDPVSVPGWLDGQSAGNGWLSLWASDEAVGYVTRNLLEVLAGIRASAGRHLAYLRVAFGRPGDELGLHSLSTELMCYGPADQKGFRRWLREDRGLDLPALGERWYGDRDRFKTWTEVRVPSYFHFFGGLDDRSLVLARGWLWRPDDPDKAHTAGWGTSAYKPGAEWTPVDLGPSFQQYFLFGSERDKSLRKGTARAAWFRKEFDAGEWVRANRGRQFYLVVNSYDWARQPVEVFLNDAYLGLMTPKVEAMGPVGLRVTALLREGKNLLVVRDPDGILRGPVFLTTTQPSRYPYLGRGENARWVDFREWQVDSLIHGWKRIVRPVRERARDLPLQLVPGTSIELADHFLELKRDFGITAIHNTGSGSSFRPWWPGLGYVIGAFGTAEEGGTSTDVRYQSRQFAWLLFLGEAHHNFFWDSEQYVRFEKKTGWFTKNRRLLQLFGKSLWRKPSIALLNSAKAHRYFPRADFVNTWDLGRGAIQATHYNCVYVTEAELHAGLAGDYPVLIDGNSPVLDREDLDAIEAYVRAGGTFIALNATGRHSLLEPDTWPISRLTGFRVAGERRNMLVTVLKDNPVLNRLAGMTFNGAGIAVNWMGVDHANRPIALEPVSPDAVVLARWEDGTAAVGLRRLGKGRVVVLGSTFWRSSSDRSGTGVTLNGTIQTVFLNDLLAGLGIQRQVDCDRERVWAVRHVTKNGLQDWLMLCNTTDDKQSGVELSFPTKPRPDSVLDMMTGKSVPFSYKNGQVRVGNLTLGAWELRVFGVRHGTFLDAVEHWYRIKAKYFSRPRLSGKTSVSPRLPPYTAVVLDRFRFRMGDGSARTDTGWTTAPANGRDWTDIGYGYWEEQGFPAKGVGLYRCRFTVPQSWQGRRIQLGFASYDTPVFLQEAEAYVNGKTVGVYQGQGWWNYDLMDITSAVHPGPNELALRVEARDVRGGALGQLVCFALERLDETIDLQEGWRLFLDNRNSRPTRLPPGVPGRNLANQVRVPESWKDRSVLLEVTADRDHGRSISTVMVNGHPLNAHGNGHPFRGTMQFNITPWVLFGGVNRIEIWPGATLPNRAGRSRVVRCPLAEVRRVVIGTARGKKRL